MRRDELENLYVETMAAKVISDPYRNALWVRSMLWHTIRSYSDTDLEHELEREKIQVPKSPWIVELFDGVVEFGFRCMAATEREAEALAHAAHPGWDIDRIWRGGL